MATTLLVGANQLLLPKRRQKFHVSVRSSHFLPSFKFTTIEAKTFINRVSTSNNEAQIIASTTWKRNPHEKAPINSILKTLNWLKFPATVSLQALFLMMIMMHRPNMARALSSGHSISLSSSSDSFNVNGTTDHKTYIDHRTFIVVDISEFIGSLFSTKPSSEVDQFYPSLFRVFLFLMVIHLILFVGVTIFPDEWAMRSEIRVIKLQVGLNMGRLGFANCFNRIAQTVHASNTAKERSPIPEIFDAETAKTTLSETAEALLDNLSCSMAGHIFVELKDNKIDAERHFNLLLTEEKKKFVKKPSFHVNKNTEESKISNTRWMGNEFKDTYMVVTILAVFTDKPYVSLPKTIATKKDLRKALRQFRAISSMAEIWATDVLWSPQKFREIMSLEKLHEKYPELGGFN